MSELEPYDPDIRNLLRQVDEFSSYPLEVRQAALEYARGLRETGTDPQVRDQLQFEDEPQFIIVGLNGGRLVFSEHVSEARMVRRVEGFDRVPIAAGPNPPMARVPRYTIALGVKLLDFEQHLGDDYPSALATLASEWRRKQASARKQWQPGHELPPGG